MNLNINYFKNQKCLIAVSGGPDSMALWHDLHVRGFRLIVAHVNYHHRDVSNDEEKMVKETAFQYGDNVEIKHAYYQKKDGNFENWARKVRYNFFKELANKYDVSTCFVGHHLDDLLETYLMQKKRGYVSHYGLKDEVSINNLNIVRPYLDLTKKELIEYCQNNNIAYSIDITNDDISLERNWIRHNIISKMTVEDKRNMKLHIDFENHQLYDEVSTAIKYLNEDNVDILRSLAPQVLDRIIFMKVQNVDKRIALSKRRIKEIKNLLNSNKGNQCFKITETCQFIREYNSLKLVKNNMFKYSLVVKSPCVVDTIWFRFNLLDNEESFYIKEDSYPLVIKNANYPHKIKIGEIHKNINRIFIDEKIPYIKRLYWPEIVNNKGEVLFVPRNAKDEKNRFIVKDL